MHSYMGEVATVYHFLLFSRIVKWLNAGSHKIIHFWRGSPQEKTNYLHNFPGPPWRLRNSWHRVRSSSIAFDRIRARRWALRKRWQGARVAALSLSLSDFEWRARCDKGARTESGIHRPARHRRSHAMWCTAVENTASRGEIAPGPRIPTSFGIGRRLGDLPGYCWENSWWFLHGCSLKTEQNFEPRFAIRNYHFQLILDIHRILQSRTTISG